MDPLTRSRTGDHEGGWTIAKRDPVREARPVYGYGRSADRRCRRPAVGVLGKSEKHGGRGPADPSQLDGNDHTAGNPGRGTPVRNTNAVIHGAWNEPLKEYDGLNEEQKEPRRQYRARCDRTIDGGSLCGRTRTQGSPLCRLALPGSL